MARFNKTAVSTVSVPNTTNLAGGDAFTMSSKLEFATALLTSLTTDAFYKSAEGQVNRIAELTRTLEDPLFAAKAAIYTRTKGGLRSVSHIVAGELSQRMDVKGQEWLRKFYSAVVIRPDDITETLSYIAANGNPKLRNLSNAMKKGFGKALASFDSYQLAKYKGSGKELNLYDAVNLLHPKASPALTELMTGSLKPADTWETKLTQAGQEATTAEEKATLKGEAWTNLLTQRKLGYMACVRNLRNIADQAPGALPLALELVQDPRQVQKSMMLPFQIYTATEAIRGSKADTPEVKLALEKAMEYSLVNVPKFDGTTLIAVDTSGSMIGKPVQIAALMTAVLFKSNNADVLHFSTNAEYLDLHPADSLTSLTNGIIERAYGGGTDFHRIFEMANKSYDRVIILSDMQAWVKHPAGGYGYSSDPHQAHKNYNKKFKCNPRIYSFDLNGQGTLQFPEERVYALAGFSDAVLRTMQNLEKDPQALVHEIEQVSFT